MAAKTPRKSPPAKPQSEQHLMLENAVGQIEKMFGKGSIMRLGESDVARDILKMAVIERHQASGAIGIGFVKGFGLKGGALAASVAHDSHNIVAAGPDDADLIAAVRAVERMQGGFAAVRDGGVLAAG